MNKMNLKSGSHGINSWLFVAMILPALLSFSAHASVIYTYEGAAYDLFNHGRSQDPSLPNVFDSSNHVNISLTFDTVLPSDFGLAGQDEYGDYYYWQNANLLAGFEFSISDGFQTFDSSMNLDRSIFRIVTDSEGDIIRWSFRVGHCIERPDWPSSSICSSSISSDYVYYLDVDNDKLACSSGDSSKYTDEPSGLISYGGKHYPTPDENGESECDNRPNAFHPQRWQRSVLADDVPEPGINVILGFGIAALGFTSARRKSKRSLQRRK